MNTQTYFQDLRKEVDKVYSVMNKARSKGYDPVDKVEIPLAMNMAEKVVGIISTLYPQMEGSKISERILELEKEFGKLDATVSFKIAEEVAKQKFCKFDSLLQSIEAGIRIGFAYQTIGVVSSPIEGFTGLKIRTTRNGKEYIEASFSGPIRSAGTTASVICLMIIDYLRELFGFAKYDPTEDEIKRVWTELEHFHDRITNLQYMPLEEEALFLARNMPIQVAGDPSEKLEVPNYKNLDRVGTNYLRSGFCLVMAEALAQKAAKGFRLYNKAKENGVKATGFDWIKEYIELHEKLTSASGKKKKDSVPVYIKDLVAGRPVFGHPSKSGGFRFRYGRGRVSGFSAVSLHPATMAITDGFIATGTQLKIEKPTKGCVTTVCDSIEGPIVKLNNGSVRQIKTLDEARKIYSDVKEIIYLGDILFPFSDLANRNSNLIKAGYVEEWWQLDLKKKVKELEKKIDCFNVPFDEAVELSKKYNIPLYPKFIFYWTEISKEEFFDLINWLKYSWIEEKLILPFNNLEKEKFALGKRALELLGVEHDITIENVVLSEENSKALFSNLGINFNLNKKRFLKEEIEFLKEKLMSENLKEDKSVLELINIVSDFEIKDKAGDFIGTRMGRPEKAKLRKLIGSPNVLFPVGKEGGRLRSVQAACEEGSVKSVFPIYYCENCKKETIYSVCEDCEKKCKKMFYCFECKEKSFEICKEHEKSQTYSYQSLNINHYFTKAREKIGVAKHELPLLIKGVKGTSSAEHKMENLSKGILRAMHDLQVNKDGTIRFDVTELPLVSFKPKEVSVNIEKLKELGYDKDIFGKELIDENQILELMPHDILLPSSFDSLDEKADDIFIRVCNFIDDLLVKFYGLESFYNIKSRDDLVGKLGVFMAPHNCAGVVCRFIGFSNSLGGFASPYMHAAVRRDCDGDEAAIMLLGDVLLNFSREFLPSHRGGTQDAPLVLNAKIDAGEVDDQILDLEMCYSYPLELYEKAEQRLHSSEVKSIPIVKNILREGKNPFVGIGFTHSTSNFNEGIACSAYKSLGTMQEKVQHQMKLVEKIRAVDTADTARLIIERHFMRDLKGNLRKFSMQEFRCVACNEIMRRPPLTGVCSKCGGKIIFTINEGGIKKYLEPALNLAQSYDLSPYLKQSLELVKRYIDSIFGRELEKQEKLEAWF
jgi:DNA polymerase II large subunit